MGASGSPRQASAQGLRSPAQRSPAISTRRRRSSRSRPARRSRAERPRRRASGNLSVEQIYRLDCSGGRPDRRLGRARVDLADGRGARLGLRDRQGRAHRHEQPGDLGRSGPPRELLGQRRARRDARRQDPATDVAVLQVGAHSRSLQPAPARRLGPGSGRRSGGRDRQHAEPRPDGDGRHRERRPARDRLRELLGRRTRSRPTPQIDRDNSGGPLINAPRSGDRASARSSGRGSRAPPGMGSASRSRSTP